MKIVVIGGRGLIGSKTVEILRKKGHEVTAASTKTGVNSVTGEGLADALKGAEVVLDLTNSPSWADDDVMTFFEKSTINLLSTSKESGVKHFVALSVVGTQGLQQSGYFRAKQKQEDYIKMGSVPYTIVQATQFFEFIGGIAEFGLVDGEIHVSSMKMQPISADDVAEMMADVALDKPLNGTLEIAGPERRSISDIVSQFMEAKKDTRKVVGSPDANYYGMKLQELSLCPADGARISSTKFEDWLKTAEAQDKLPV
jgi:uncharacterized protein YbjT (DUF2867 family)